MSYKEFFNLVNDSNFNKETYDELVQRYGYTLIQKFFNKYINSNKSDEAYEKCKYYLEDELEMSFRDDEYISNSSLDSEDQYMNEIIQIRMLEPEEEKIMLIRINNLRNEMNELDEKYNIKEKINTLKDEICEDENIIEIKRYLELEKEYNSISNKLIETNLRLVVSVAKHYKGNNVDFLDLIQEGNFGLKAAIDRFDVEKGNKFSTYAIWWIKRYIINEIYQNSRTVRIPVHRHELLFKLKKAACLYEKDNGRMPNSQELLDYIKDEVQKGNIKNSRMYAALTVDIIDNLMAITQNVTSLYAKVGEDEESTLQDFLTDTQEDTVENTTLKSLVKQDIGNVFDLLGERYKMVLILRYGFPINEYMSYKEFFGCFTEIKYSEDYYKQLYANLSRNVHIYTLESIATILGLTRERIRQIEMKALFTLRKKNRIEKILEPDLLDLYK